MLVIEFNINEINDIIMIFICGIGNVCLFWCIFKVVFIFYIVCFVFIVGGIGNIIFSFIYVRYIIFFIMRKIR